MIRTAALGVGISIGLVLTAGCGHKSTTGISQTQQIQYGNAAESANNQVMDAALSALVLQATSSTPPGDPVRTLGAIHRLGSATTRAELTRLTSGAFIVSLNQLLDVNGAKLFPTLAGAFTVTPSGTAVTSWPTGSNQQAVGTASVVFDQGPVTYTDPGDGLVETISLGSFTMAVVSTYQYTSLMNWTITIDAQTQITPTNELTYTALPPNQPTHQVTLYGFRHVSLTETRASTTGVNSLQIVKTVDGNGVPGSAPGGVIGIDPQVPNSYFTSMVHIIDLIQPDTVADTWNRLETTTTTWDYTQVPAGRAQTISVQQIMITRDGVVSGPTNTAGLLSSDSTLSSN